MRLSVRGGSYAYGSHDVIRDLDLDVRENAVLTVLGPNGVGKTTLLKCLMGFLRWRSGQTLLDERPLSSYSHRELWTHVSYVPQAKRSPFAYSVVDTVVMGLNAGSGLFSSPRREDYDRAYAMLERLGIQDIASRSCAEVSGGQLQMALIARALVGEPQVLVLDEPESNLDMRNQLRVLEAILEVARGRDTTCVINTHYPEHAFLVSDDTLFMGTDGSRLFGPTEEVVTEENIRAFYRVDARVVPVRVGCDRMRTVFPYAIAR